MDAQNLTWIAAAGLLASFWRQLLALFQRVRTFIIVKTTLRGQVSTAVTAYCWRHFRLRQIASRILGAWPETIEPVVASHPDYTGAQFTEACVQEALKRYWKS